MKKRILYIVLATLCLNFGSKAQDNKAVDITATGLQIGQEVPEINILNLHNYKDKKGKSATSAKLSDFKGKLLILDFWATWCSPCVAMIPKMDSLQKEFGDKIQFLSITYQSEKEVLPFMKRYQTQKGKHYDLPIVTDDTVLSRVFPYKNLPHYVWLDSTGKVVYITGHREITQENIFAVLSGESKLLSRKKDFIISYDPNKPLFNDRNGGDGGNMIYHSILTGYTAGLGASFNFKKAEGIAGVRMTIFNLPIKNILAFAYARGKTVFNDKRIVVLSKDSLLMTRPKNAKPVEWQTNNSYCYELVIPERLKDDLFNFAISDLQRLFPQYVIKVKPEKQQCMALIRTSESDRIKSKGGSSVSDFGLFGFKLKNFPLARLTAQLNVIYMQGSSFWISDETGYTDPVDLAITANMSSFEEINKALEPYELKYVQKEITVDKLIIDDKK